VALVRFARATVPRTSARTTAIVAFVALVTTAALVPLPLHLPKWIEAEIVLVLWWLIGIVAIAWVLWRGRSIAQDHGFRAPWDRVAAPGAKSGSGSSRGGSSSAGGRGTNWLDPSGCADAEGCLAMLLGIVLVVVAIGAAWFLVELVAPALFFLFYGLFLAAIRRAAAGRDDARGNFIRALAWGGFWSTVYVAPLALVVIAVHAALRASGVH
jgi:hypothetical protein